MKAAAADGAAAAAFESVWSADSRGNTDNSVIIYSCIIDYIFVILQFDVI